MSDNIHFNPNEILSHNLALNFIVASRGYGKTYGSKKFVMNRFIKKGEQFIYLKRHKNDLDQMDTFFDKLQKEFPDNQFTVKGKTFFCDGNICGYAIPLSSWQKKKSIEFPDVTTLIYDEFIKEKDLSHYLPNEVESFLNFVDTVFRDREDFRVFLLGNAVTLANPYFMYFKLYPKKDQELYKKGEYLVNIPRAERFKEYRKQTRVGRITKGTNYEQYALYNEWKDDEEAFIEKRTPQSKYVCTFEVDKQILGLWFDKNKNLLYLSNKSNKSHPIYIVTKKENYKEGRVLVSNYKQHFHTGKVGRAFLKGQLMFDNIYVRESGYELLKQLKVQ